MNFIAGTISLFVIVPVLTLFVFYFIFLKVTKMPKKALLFAADATTIFLMYAVYSLTVAIWGISIGWWIFLLFVLTLLTFLFIFYRIKDEIDIKKSFRITWRFHFLLYLITYVGLFLYGMIDRIIQGIQ